MNGPEGYVGFSVIGVALMILSFIVVRNEGWRAVTDGRRRRRQRLFLGGFVAVVGLALAVIGFAGLLGG